MSKMNLKVKGSIILVNRTDGETGAVTHIGKVIPAVRITKRNHLDVGYWKSTRIVEVNGCHSPFKFDVLTKSGSVYRFQVFGGSKDRSKVRTRELAQTIARIADVPCFV